MGWLPLLLAALLTVGSGYWVFHMIVQWILSDAPPGTRMFGISNGKTRKE